MNHADNRLKQQSSRTSLEISDSTAPTQQRSEDSHRATNQVVAMSTAETLLNTLPSNSAVGDAMWPNIGSVSRAEPYRAQLDAANEVMYPQSVLGTEQIGFNIGALPWARDFGSETTVHPVPPAEDRYSLPSANASHQLASSNSNALLRIPEEFWPRGKYLEPLGYERYRIDDNRHDVAFPCPNDNIMDPRFAVPQMETPEEAFGRRPSVSTYSTSNAGLPADALPHIEEPSMTLDASEQAAECVATPSTDPSSSIFTTIRSPRHPLRQEHAGSFIRERASSSPRRNMRAAPYSIDHERSNRWSTGAVTQDPALHYDHELIYLAADGSSNFPGPHLSIPPSPSQPYIGSLWSSSNHQGHISPILASQPLTSQGPSTLLSLPIRRRDQNEMPSTLSSHKAYRVSPPLGGSRLQQRYHDPKLPAPPDLYASLRTPEDPPPPEDMSTTDPDLVPHQQDLRFDGDLYTPRWVRGQGNKREGWCGICKPGRWLVLKNSAFWYDKSFSHGISAATGAPFEGPQANRPLEGSTDVWEGYCGSCHEWISLVSSKRKGTTWFRHAYKCHAHPRNRDPPKRRRDDSGSPSSKKMKALPSSIPYVGSTDSPESLTPSVSPFPEPEDTE
ncbi:MAG: hypothetical protein M1816_000544 [Peltula sp. TS41687]|nr:MAG: hypothetical protein M1816_000544 [Peltula sp. TS41687]